MFTIDQIKEAHSKVKSGTDFPTYIQALIKLGVIRYITYVTDGHTVYFGNNNYQVQSEAKYSIKEIEEINVNQFLQALKTHQDGQTDYLTFCSQSAGFGIDNWEVNTIEMTCTYHDKIRNKILIEKIPTNE